MLFLAGLDGLSAPPAPAVPSAALMLARLRFLSPSVRRQALHEALDVLKPGAGARMQYRADAYAGRGVPSWTALHDAINEELYGVPEHRQAYPGMAYRQGERPPLPLPPGLGKDWYDYLNPVEYVTDFIDYIQEFDIGEALEDLWDEIQESVCEYVVHPVAIGAGAAAGAALIELGPAAILIGAGTAEAGRQLGEQACKAGVKTAQKKIAAMFAGRGADVKQISAKAKKVRSQVAQDVLRKKRARLAQLQAIREAKWQAEQVASRVRVLDDVQRVQIRLGLLAVERRKGVSNAKIGIMLVAGAAALWLLFGGGGKKA